MNLRKKNSQQTASLRDQDETMDSSSEIPSSKLFVKKFNFCLMKALKPSSRKSGPMRNGFFTISYGQYQALLHMGISHRFKQHQFLLSEFNLKTERFFSIKNRVTVQTDTFEARLQKPRKLKFYESMMKQSELDSSEYFLKIRFKKCEEVIQNWTAWFAAIMQSNPPVFFKTTNLKNKAKLNNHTSLSMLFYWVYVVFWLDKFTNYFFCIF